MKVLLALSLICGAFAFLDGVAPAADGPEIVELIDDARAREGEISERDKYLLEHYLSKKTYVLRTPDGRYVDTVVELEGLPDPAPFASRDLDEPLGIIP